MPSTSSPGEALFSPFRDQKRCYVVYHWMLLQIWSLPMPITAACAPIKSYPNPRGNFTQRRTVAMLTSVQVQSLCRYINNDVDGREEAPDRDHQTCSKEHAVVDTTLWTILASYIEHCFSSSHFLVLSSRIRSSPSLLHRGRSRHAQLLHELSR